MKYIRTNDGIYEIVEDLYFGRFLLNNKKIVSLSDSDVKQADTIEELCDEFVCRDLYYYKLSKKIIDMLDNKDKTKIYGAIWTKKGLIFIAKLKGILPNGKIDWKLV